MKLNELALGTYYGYTSTRYKSSSNDVEIPWMYLVFRTKQGVYVINIAIDNEIFETYDDEDVFI